jgi:hypothetical protein
VLPSQTLPSAVAVVSVGLINMCANVAGLFGSPAVGEMKKAGLTDGACLLFLAACYVLGGGIIALLHVPTSSRKALSE